MSWWSNADVEPKRKNKFYVELGTGGILYSVTTISKPTVNIDTKEYTLINHVYKYPGIPRWDPISIKFVDGGIWGGGSTLVAGKVVESNPRSTSKTLWEMLLATGYVTPSGEGSNIASLVKVRSPEKAATIDLSFGSSENGTDGKVFRIHQVNGDGEKTETWVLYNPLITRVSWGDLDYGQDELVEYSLDVAYDWAELVE